MTVTDSVTTMTSITNGMETHVVKCEVDFGGKNRPAFFNEPGLIGLDFPT
jgi:hypothetical protein